MYGKDVPVRVNGAARSAKDNITTGMRPYPLGDVVDFVAVDNPRVVRMRIMFANFGDAISRKRGIRAIGRSALEGIASCRGLLREVVSKVKGGCSREKNCNGGVWVFRRSRWLTR
jgi:hypothetical protein